MNNKQLQIGWASTSITPDRPIVLHGQLYHRISSYVHDPITATALVVENGDEQFTMVSLDVASVSLDYIERVLNTVSDIKGLDPGKITFSATHTHNSSRFTDDPHRELFEKNIGGDVLQKIQEPENLMTAEESRNFIHDKLVSIIRDAWENRKPGGISYASDYAAIGFNRRPVFDLGEGKTESKMYGVCSQDNFLRFEGTVDHSIDMLYTWDLERNLTGVLVDVPAPSQVRELHYFISADYWGPARNYIRDRLGNINVLSICGAAGDQNPLDLVRLSKTNVQELKDWNAQAGEVFRNFDMENECSDIGERIAEAVSRGCRKAKNRIQTRPVFRHSVIDITLPIRKVTEQDYLEALNIIEEKRSHFSPDCPMSSADQVSLFEPVGIINRWKQLQKSSNYSFKSNIIRLGDITVATNPFELFVEYSLRIRARTKAEQVFIFQLTNGSGGYLPTEAAIAGGSYSSKPASTVVGPDSGVKLTERLIAEIDKLWQ